MSAPWMTLLGVLAIAVLVVVVPIVADAFSRYRRQRIVQCPEAGRPARVLFDATLAAMTSFPGPSKLRVERCSLWPYRADCAQACARDAG